MIKQNLSIVNTLGVQRAVEIVIVSSAYRQRIVCSAIGVAGIMNDFDLTTYEFVNLRTLLIIYFETHMFLFTL